MLKRLRRLLPVLVLLTTSVIAVGPLSQPATADDCPDVHVFGVAGSGEDPRSTDPSQMGVNAVAAYNKFVAHMRKKNLSVEAEAIDYPAISAWPPWESSFYIKMKWESVPKGVEALQKRFTEQARKCKDQEFVLMGYSQGAWVIQDTLPRLTSLDGAHSRIKAVVLFGDPWYDPDDDFAMNELGENKGVLSLITSFGKDVLTSTILSARVVKTIDAMKRRRLPDWLPNARTYCHKGDVLCDTANGDLKKCLSGEDDCPITVHIESYVNEAEEVGKWLASLPWKTAKPAEPAPNPGPRRPDLAVTSLSRAPGPLCTRADVRVAGVIKNQGGTPSGRFTYRWLVDGRPAHKSVRGLRPGQTMTTVAHLNRIRPGRHTFQLIADPSARVPDLTRKNNSSKLTVTVAPCSNAGSGVPRSFMGTWHGTVTQTGAYDAVYTTTLTIEGGTRGERVGHVAYPTLNCQGELYLVSATATTLTLDERIEPGDHTCLAVVRLTLRANGDGTLHYHFDGEGDATLRRAT